MVICRKQSSGKGDFAVSANVAYGEVNLHAKPVYEDLNKMARSGRDNYELVEHPFPGDVLGSQHLCVGTDERTSALNTNRAATSSH